MAKFVFAYRGGEVPATKREQNDKDWYAWLPTINEQVGVRVAGNSVVGADGIQAPDRAIQGISIIEASSLAAAQNLAKSCPGLANGGDVLVLEEWKM